MTPGGPPGGRASGLAPVDLSAATAVVGVVGDPVAHSLSPRLHNAAFAALGIDWVSVGFPVPAGQVNVALDGGWRLGIRGLSVTMPHKEAAAHAAARRSPLVARLGAANCLVAGDDGWSAESTDGPGLVAALRRGGGLDPAGRRCLVVGAGGAGRAVVAALADAGAAEIVVVNRSRGRAEQAVALAGPAGRRGSASEAAICDLVVNATPLGMGGPAPGPPAGAWPVAPASLGPGQLVVDLVYHPPVTPWLAAAASRGARTMNGLGMLVHQAALQVARWTGMEAPVEDMWRAVSGGTVVDRGP